MDAPDFVTEAAGKERKTGNMTWLGLVHAVGPDRRLFLVFLHDVSASTRFALAMVGRMEGMDAQRLIYPKASSCVHPSIILATILIPSAVNLGVIQGLHHKAL